jgi:hypothetical protein
LARSPWRRSRRSSCSQSRNALTDCTAHCAAGCSAGRVWFHLCPSGLTIALRSLLAACSALSFHSKVYYARPYTFIGLGVFCLMANMLAMIHLAYYMREYQHTDFEEYVHVTSGHWSGAHSRAHARARSRLAATGCRRERDDSAVADGCDCFAGTAASSLCVRAFVCLAGTWT